MQLQTININIMNNKVKLSFSKRKCSVFWQQRSTWSETSWHDVAKGIESLSSTKERERESVNNVIQGGEVLTWRCFTCTLLHFDAGMTATFMIWIHEDLALCLAAMSRSVHVWGGYIVGEGGGYIVCVQDHLITLFSALLLRAVGQWVIITGGIVQQDTHNTEWLLQLWSGLYTPCTCCASHS